MHKNLFYFFAIMSIAISFHAAYGETGQSKFDTAIWFGAISVGGAVVLALLYHTTKRNKPIQYSQLPVIQFILLTTLLGCMIAALTFWPDEIFRDTPLSQEIRMDNATNTTNYYFVIGGNGKDKALLEIPYYVIIPGMFGAYIRYLYKEIRLYRMQFRKELIELTNRYLKHKNKILEICLAIGFSRKDIENYILGKSSDTKKDLEKPRGFFVRGSNILEFFKEKNNIIYSLPPEAVYPFSRYIKKQFCDLSTLENSYDSLNFKIRDKAIYKTIYVIGIFFLAPLLAIISWLLLGLGDTEKFEVYVIMAFGAGLTADTIVRKIWSLAGDKISANPDEDLNDDETQSPQNPNTSTKTNK